MDTARCRPRLLAEQQGPEMRIARAVANAKGGSDEAVPWAAHSLEHAEEKEAPRGIGTPTL